MELDVKSTTFREAIDEESLFPPELRQLLCDAVRQIPAEELPELLGKHETDPDNFDRRIEENLRALLLPSTRMQRDYRVSPRGRFNHDLVIEDGEVVICVEIEKGYLARFEFDVLKMMASSGCRKEENPDLQVSGAFIVPLDNVVARHISGNSRESSFEYLIRISRLFREIQPFPLEDILFLGYGLADLEEEPRRQKGRRPKTPGPGLLRAEGLIPEQDLPSPLKGYPLELISYIRKRLYESCPDLHEKFNPNSRYFGYARGVHRDGVYIFVRKRHLEIRLKIAVERVDEVRAMGFRVKLDDNFQARAGWITGWLVPHDTEKRDEVVGLLLEALGE
jgi:hypothetical protein